MIKRLWEFNTAAYDLWFSIPSRKYRDADGLKTIENFVKLVKERKMKQVLAKIAEGMDLTSAELEAAMEEVVAGRASEAQVTAFF